MKKKIAVIARAKDVYIRHALPEDERLYLRAVKASHSFVDPWGVPPHTPKQYRDFLDPARCGECARFFVCRKADDAFAGMINLNGVTRFHVQTSDIGYNAFAPFHGHGYMTQGMKLVMHYAFNQLKLHRLEAGIQPANTRSIALARKVGFNFEGLAKRLVKINGRWTDHERWAILKEEMQGRWTRN
jgi:ribosomal-protein-alanine N-acetyltransferase